jgi:hypothetical protein
VSRPDVKYDTPDYLDEPWVLTRQYARVLILGEWARAAAFAWVAPIVDERMT